MKKFLALSLAFLLSSILFGVQAAHAAITLPFQTTYNCAEQTQPWSGVLCDGIQSAGGWTADSTHKEQITTSANYSGGGGGRGQRHWFGNGHNVNSGSLQYSLSAGVSELYVRWYFRHQTGMKLGAASGSHKMLYFNQAQCAGNVNGCYILIQPGSFRLTVAGTNYNNGSFGWNSLYPAAGNPADEVWHWMVVRVKSNTSGQANGIAQVWVGNVGDTIGAGTLRFSRTDVTFSTGGGNFTGFLFPSNGDINSTGCTGSFCFEDYDDVAVQTTQPSLIGGGTPPPPTDNPPTGSVTAPVNNSTATASPVTLTCSCSDVETSCASAQFKVDGVDQGALDTSAPFTTDWTVDASNNGPHQITCELKDTVGNTVTPTAVNVIVSISTSDVTPPSTCEITQPSASQVIQRQIELKTNAVDAASGIDFVEFLFDDVAITNAMDGGSHLTTYQDRNTPYSLAQFDTTGKSEGVHTFKARCCDVPGNCTTSAAVSVTINNAAITPTSFILGAE